MPNTFFIAALHFGDDKIIKFENRPFLCAKDMDMVLIDNWNFTVCKDDICFVLGDYSFHDRERTAEITKSLNGKKYLVMGNHDTENEEYYYSCGFEGVSRFPIIFDGFWMLSHEPLYICENMPYANIFGHVHKNPIYTDYSKQSFCVCADRTNFAPISFNRIKELMGIT